MDAKAKELARYLVERVRDVPHQSRLIVGIAGIPASGKTTLAKLIVDHINVILKTEIESASAERTEAIVIGLDGWHLTRAQLASLPHPQLAKDRRGAHWTFDPDSYLEFVRHLRVPLSPSGPVVEPIIAPSFDHAVKDPDPTGVEVYPWHRIVVIEGLYCFLSIGAWKEAGEMLDERWLTAVDFEKATERIIDRHVASGVAGSIEEAQWRARENDMPNGKFLLDNSLEPTRIIESVQDQSPRENDRC
ncbi:P-loop containing nucleoside triphosphate hydrolase protein [Thelephora terrestris]|uniref:P-loop containing nucleoside triphosphate hydrolase protein n=1 Tax=Thelephora terrestris TaxID=56493 RepID=A0A9P6L7N0_9AGAM|nr:P-loop containing nucleoside triphosphate hydrolase protein [Thelephora terrestris]